VLSTALVTRFTSAVHPDCCVHRLALVYRIFSASRFITFRVSRRRREMYIGHARLCVFVCLSVCLSVRRRIPALLHGPGCNLKEWQRFPLVLHYWKKFAIGARVSLL